MIDGASLILVIEDDPSIRYFVRLRLEAQGERYAEALTAQPRYLLTEPGLVYRLATE